MNVPSSVTYSNDLEPAIQAIFDECPRFRVLVVGKSGVGKSSLINKAFNVDIAVSSLFLFPAQSGWVDILLQKVAHNERGISNIDQEIISTSNERFVLHDSQGLEAGETDNLKTLENFIQTRQSHANLSEKIHAIWLCIQTPSAGGRVLERGTELLLEFSQKVPMIIIFTKYDELVTEKGSDLSDSAWEEDEEECARKSRDLADDDFQRLCVEVVQKFLVGRDMPPLVKVSTENGYETTLTELIQVTEKHIQSSLATLGNKETVSIVMASAQAVDPSTKVAATISVGKKRYWRGLASSTRFPGLSLATCLHVIHHDVILVWNFKDTDSYLLSSEFMAILFERIGDYEGHRTKSVAKSLTGAAGAVAAVLGAVFPPTAPIVVPTVFCTMVLATWLYTTYQATPRTLQHLMGYICDLTNVMRGIFYRNLTAEGSKQTIKQLTEDTVTAYHKWDCRETIIREVVAFTSEKSVFEAANKDYVLQKLIELINKYEYKG